MRNNTFLIRSAAAVMAGVLVVSAMGADAVALSAPGGKKFYSDDPIWAMPKPVAVKNPARRPLSEYYDFFENTLFAPGERAKQKGVYLPSQGINTVDEVPDSAWYTNRHATRRMSIDELKRGAGNENAPEPGTWAVVAAKNEGITPGFRIRDAKGREYMVKFDPMSNPELASAADVITSRFFHALGYNVPENYIVYFDAAQLVVDKDGYVRDAAGKRRPIRQTDVAEMLAKAPKAKDGRYRAMASRLLPGRPLGPFKYDGMRGDDPNDLIPHEHRRDLRALRTLCAWLGHDDSKALNTLDTLVQEDGTPFIKHWLIDFGASLGSASFRANSPRDGNVYLFDWKSSATQFLTLGLYAPKWQRAKYPALPSVGLFEYEVFDPNGWVGDYPSTAFRNENPADRAWAARKIATFTDEEIRAMVALGQYSDPAAEAWVARCIIERRNKIVAAFLTGTAALEGFDVRDGQLQWRYAGKNAAAPAIRWSTFDNRTGERRILPGETTERLPRVSAEYVMAELTGPGPAISVYVKAKGDRPIVVGVERAFATTNVD
jgi:hypothetical protein